MKPKAFPVICSGCAKVTRRKQGPLGQCKKCGANLVWLFPRDGESITAAAKRYESELKRV